MALMDETTPMPNSTVSMDSDFGYDYDRIRDKKMIDEDDDDSCSVSTEDYYNNHVQDDDGSNSATEDVYFNPAPDDHVSASEPVDLSRCLPTGFPRKKRATWSDEIPDRWKNEIVSLFKLLDQSKKRSGSDYDECSILKRIKRLLLQQSYGFLQSIGVDIKETNILNILQASHPNSKLDSENPDAKYQHLLHSQDETIATDKKSDEENTSNIGGRSGGSNLDSEKRSNDCMGVIDKPMKKLKLTGKLKSLSCLIDSNNSPGSLYECKECKRIFTDFRALGGHMAFHGRKNMSELQDTGSNYECHICKEIFDDFRALGGHVASHNRRNRAEQAAFEGGNGSNLASESADGGKGKIYECNICSRKFSTGQALGGHKTFHRKVSANFGIVERSGQLTGSAENPVFELDLNATPDEGL